jgi:glycosyltransferase involved in cell wall biosynthesis
MEMNERPGICLNMIVKNETKVLDRLFRSVKEYISYYVIVDTGSTDGTPEFIRERMEAYGIPGEVHVRPWVNFGVNRNEALQLAYAADSGCRWVLLIDADEELACSDPGFFGRMEPGITYELEKHHNNLRYALANLVDIRSSRWEWRGPVHEALCDVDGNGRRQRCSDAWIIYHEGEGARSQGVSQEEKFLRDARLLEDELQRHPEDCRSRFYLAQSYRDAGHLQKAYDNYRLRAGMSGGWEQETFVAQLEAGRMARRLQLSHAVVLEELLASYNLRSTRAEPLHELAVHCRLLQRFGEAYLFARMGSLIPYPADTLFVNRDVYQWRLLDELSVAAFWTGRYDESRTACEELLLMHAAGEAIIGEEHLERIRKNLEFAKGGER